MQNLKTFIIFVLVLALFFSIAEHVRKADIEYTRDEIIESQSQVLISELYSEEFEEHLTAIISNSIEIEIYESEN